MSAIFTIFAKGDKVRIKKHHPGLGLSPETVYVIGAVQALASPHRYHVDPYYWSDPKWSWARKKSRLDVAGHPQVLFLDEVLEETPHIPKDVPDPDLKGRRSFSGVWFEKVKETSDMNKGAWTLEGYDTFDGTEYPIPGYHTDEASAQAAARTRLEELEKTQPSKSSGGQSGIQDQVSIVRPDGSKYRFTG